MTITAVTERSSASDRRSSLLKSLKVPGIILGIIAVLAGIIALATPERSDVRFAPDNPSEAGAMALAEVLKNEGVDVFFTRTYSEAISHATTDSTVLIADPPYWMDTTFDELYNSGADLVLLSPSDEIVSASSLAFGTELTSAGSYQESLTSTAQCDLPAAVAAGSIRNFGYGFEEMSSYMDDSDEIEPSPAATNLTMCFPMEWGAHLAQLTKDDGTTLTLFDDSSAFSNGVILENGHAALALQLLGEHKNLVWYLPLSSGDPGTEDVEAGWPLPFNLFMATAGVAILFLAIWQGRRLGPVISEQLPVVVKASETTLGRGRLYRSAGARGRAAAALRAGSATRLGARLGISSSSEKAHFITLVAIASHRSELEINDLFYGPTPQNDAPLTTLAQQLSALESEINA